MALWASDWVTKLLKGVVPNRKLGTSGLMRDMDLQHVVMFGPEKSCKAHSALRHQCLDCHSFWTCSTTLPDGTKGQQTPVIETLLEHSINVKPWNLSFGKVVFILPDSVSYFPFSKLWNWVTEENDCWTPRCCSYLHINHDFCCFQLENS